MALVRNNVDAIPAAAEEQAATAEPVNEAAKPEAEPTKSAAQLAREAAEKAIAEAEAAEKAEAEAKAAQAEPQAEAEEKVVTGEVVEGGLPFEGDEELLAADQKATAEAEEQAKAALQGKPSQALAQANTQTGAMAPAGAKGNKTLVALAEDGFDGLNVDGFGAFPLVKLETEGHFADTDGKKLGKWFDMIAFNSRTKFVYKNTKCTTKEEEVAYSYDGVTESNSNEPLETLFKEWATKGWGVERKDYLEVSAQLLSTDADGDGRDGEFVMLSIPPTSLKRISGFFAQTAVKRRLKPNQYVTRCAVGDKVEKADNPFYPWSFEFSRIAPADGE